VIGNADGKVMEPRAGDPRCEAQLAAAAFTSKQLALLGEQLGMGQPLAFNVAGSGRSWVVAMRPGHLFLAECDGARSAASVESTLANADWVGHIELPIDDREVEYVKPGPSKNRPRVALPQRGIPKPDGRHDVPQRPIPPARLPLTPAAAARPAVPNRTPENLQEAGEIARTEALLAELRRNLVKGQLRQAEGVAAKLLEDAKARNTASDSAPLPTQLLEGIAMVLAGDAIGGLANLKAVEGSAKSSTLRWASLVWCARASASAGAGFDATQAYAQTALTVAAQLDTEARAVSTYELAGVAFHKGDAGNALELTHTARSLFGNGSDAQLVANCWLLEARVLSAIGNHQESIGAANSARQQRPSWPAPSLFVARGALRDGHLREADAALQGLLTGEPVPTDIERARTIIEHVKTNAIPLQSACLFLDLIDAPPTPENIRKLEELSELHPQVDHFRDALGWHLLRSGQYESASVLFDRLSSRSNLPEDVRSSVLLALGCLAAASARTAKPGVRIRAAVDATPKNFKSAKPTPPSSGKLRKAAPVEFRISDLPPPPAQVPSNGPQQPADGVGVAPSTWSRAVFSGNLQLFALPDLLEFLRSGQRTGTLVCSSSAGIGAIHLRRGLVTGAASPKTKGLRDYLIAMGVVTRASLQNLDSKDSTDQNLIGGTLVRSGIASVEQVRLALHDQLHDAIKELMNWGVGQFAFDPEASNDAPNGDVQIELDPQEILLNIFKEIDENANSPG
jgi:tetratricopeptide (TPR) repeat protein